MSGKLRQEIHVQHHLIGAAAAFANPWREWRRCTSAAERVKKPFGTPVSKKACSSSTVPVGCNINVNVLLRKKKMVQTDH